MAIGMKPRKKGLFGRNVPFPATPGIGDGMDQMPTGVDPAPGLGMRSAAPEPEKPGFLGQGGVGRAIIGNVADAISQHYGGMPVYAQGMAERQREEQARQQAAAKMREKAMEDAQWYRRENWKRENSSTAMQQNYEYLRQIDPEAAESYLKRQTDPIQWITGPDGVPRPYGVGQANRPAVGSVMADPRKGGASSNASGGF